MRLFTIAALTLVLLSLRFIHLDADQPESIWSENVGEFIDEGSKVLDARNIVLFGAPRIGPEDDNPGWIHRSPVTQWIFVGAFRLFSPSLVTARLVSLSFFVLFLTAFVLGPGREYRLSTTLLGLALFGLAHEIFLFSRTAVFEMPLILAVYSPVFLIRTRLGTNRAAVATSVAALIVIAAVGIKVSGLLYLGLASLGMMAAAFPSLSRLHRRWAFALLGLLSLVSALSYLQLGVGGRVFRPHIQTDPLMVFRSIVENPLIRASPLLVAAGVFCMLHWTLADPARLFGNRYRMALATVALGGPVVLAFLTPSHLRYHIPLLPAYLLLTLDWLDSRPWTDAPTPSRNRLGLFVGVPLAVLSIVCLTHALNRFLLAPIVEGGAGSPSSTGPVTLTFLVVLSMTGAAVVLYFRAHLVHGPNARLVVTLTLVVALIANMILNVSFLVSPGFRRQTIAAQLEESLQPGQVLAGDWSPYFTIDTSLRALWVSERFSVNTFSRLPETRPDFILFVETRDDALFEALPNLPGVALDEPRSLGSYLEREMFLYPVKYADADRTNPEGNSIGAGTPQ